MEVVPQRHETTDRRNRIEADRRRKRDFIRKRDERDKRREDIEDQSEDAATAFAAAATISLPAPPKRYEAMDATLTQLDIAVVEALLNTDKLIEKVNLEILAMLELAFLLPDGRRVFKSEDGTKVFDEFGEEIPADIVDPDQIPADAPTWEEFKAAKDLDIDLNAQREAILGYQSQLDTAREEIADGEMTTDELDELEVDLLEAMPPAVAEYVPEEVGPAVGQELNPVPEAQISTPPIARENAQIEISTPQ